MNKNLVIPYPAMSASVSCMDLGAIDEQIKAVEASSTSFFHYDVVDGEFNRCFILGDLLCEYLKKNSRLPIEVHLAVYDVDKYIEVFAKKGVEYIAVHYEAMKNPKQIFEKIRNLGAQPILAYRADTPPGEDFPELVRQCPWVLKLTVNPGFSGQKINPAAIDHIKMMRDMIKAHKLTTRIQVDGNVNAATIQSLTEAGGSIFTGGTSGLFLKEGTIEENIERCFAPIRDSFIERM